MANTYKIEGKISKEELDKLKARVKKHWGGMNKVATKCERSRNWVRDVLNGKYEDLKVVGIALEVCKELDFEEKKKEFRRAELREKIAAI